MHVGNVPWPEAFVFDSIQCKKKQLIGCISGFQMERKIRISGCFNKEEDSLNLMEVIHH